jgi:hypothetical protein
MRLSKKSSTAYVQEWSTCSRDTAARGLPAPGRTADEAPSAFKETRKGPGAAIQGHPRAHAGKRKDLVPGMPEGRGTVKLSRREIIEELKRQGLYGITKIKAECRRFERYWEARTEDSARSSKRCYSAHIRE